MDTEMSDAELRRYFRFADDLAKARRASDPHRIREAVDELEVIALHTERPSLRARIKQTLRYALTPAQAS